MKIIMTENCGNSPKQETIKNLNVAFAKADTGAILDYFADNATWEMPGHKPLKGKEEIAESLKLMENDQASELILYTVISHGKFCAANGEIAYADGRRVEYCDMYTFDSHAKDAKIKTLVGYAIENKEHNKHGA